LDVLHAAKEDVRVLMLEGSEGAADRVLGPALRVGLYGIFKEAVKRGEQFGRQLSQLKLADQIGGFADNEVIAVSQCFAQSFQADFRRLLAEFVHGSQLLFELVLAGHKAECNSDGAWFRVSRSLGKKHLTTKDTKVHKGVEFARSSCVASFPIIPVK